MQQQQDSSFSADVDTPIQFINDLSLLDKSVDISVLAHPGGRGGGPSQEEWTGALQRIQTLEQLVMTMQEQLDGLSRALNDKQQKKPETKKSRTTTGSRPVRKAAVRRRNSLTKNGNGSHNTRQVLAKRASTPRGTRRAVAKAKVSTRRVVSRPTTPVSSRQRQRRNRSASVGADKHDRSRSRARSASPAAGLRKKTKSKSKVATALGAQQRYCYFDISIGVSPIGRVVFELFWELCPHTCANFLALCTGSFGRGKLSGKKLFYKGTKIHRVITGFMLQGGDVVNNDGTSGESIYGRHFADENFTKQHSEPGLLSMANAGPDTNSSQFFVTLIPTPWLDGKNVCFGKIVTGLTVIKAIEKVGTKVGQTKKTVVITGCGSLDALPKSRRDEVAAVKKARSAKSLALQERQQQQQQQQLQLKQKKTSAPLQKQPSRTLPLVFFDIAMDGKLMGRCVIELRSDVVPYTAENFRVLCTGQRGYGYKGCDFHRIYGNHACQAGDITSRDGFGGRSIFAAEEDAEDPGYFKDENFTLKHSQAGVVSMANAGPDSNTSQFMVMLRADPSNNGKNVVVGQVVEGLKVFYEMNKHATPSYTPSKVFTIVECGQLLQ